MKKLSHVYRISAVGAFILAVGLMLTGCPDSSGGSAEAGRGVLGQISGVVYDTVTAQPIQGVSVELSSQTPVTTDKNGAYLFKDVKPGVYTVTYGKDGYRFSTKNVKVDPQQYIKDDPFKESAALAEQLGALNDWAKSSTFPEYTASGSETPSWTYQGGGIYVSGEGSKVEVSQENGQFKVTEIKMDYTYSYALPLYLTGLAPLTGAVKGQVKLINVPFADRVNVKIADALAPPATAEFWLVEAGYGIGFEDATNTNPVSAAVRYGPFTSADGAFEFKGVPVGVALQLWSGGFTTDGYYFKADSKAYGFSYDEVEFGGGSSFTSGDPADFKAENNGIAKTAADQTYTDVGTLYLFTEGDLAFVTGNTTGTPAAPIAPDGTITLTFNKDIDPARFAASVEIPVSGNATNTNAVQSISLTAAWTDAKTATLKPAEVPDGLVKAVFPYSKNGTKSLGTLKITGYATDGSVIFANGDQGKTKPDPIPVYTTEGLKLAGIDLSPADIPASRVALTKSAVKLTFTKAVDAYARFAWGTSITDKAAEYTISSTDGKSVFVWTDALTVGTGRALWYEVFSKDDITDTTDEQQVGDTNTSFEKAPANQRLVLASTNIYANKKGVDPSGTEAQFNAASMTLTFTRAIPADAKVNAVLTQDVNITSMEQTSISLKPPVIDAARTTVTIEPSVPLLHGASGAKYNLAVQIVSGNQEIFGSVDLPSFNTSGNGLIATGPAPGTGTTFYYITFTTSPLGPAVAQRASGTNATSSIFNAAGLGTANTTIQNVSMNLNTKYYIQFNGPVTYTAPTLPAGNGGWITSSNAALQFLISAVASDVLSIEARATPGGAGYTTAITVSVPTIGSGAADATGTISSVGRQLVMTNITVNP